MYFCDNDVVYLYENIYLELELVSQNMSGPSLSPIDSISWDLNLQKLHY